MECAGCYYICMLVSPSVCLYLVSDKYFKYAAATYFDFYFDLVPILSENFRNYYKKVTIRTSVARTERYLQITVVLSLLIHADYHLRSTICQRFLKCASAFIKRGLVTLFRLKVKFNSR